MFCTNANLNRRTLPSIFTLILFVILVILRLSVVLELRWFVVLLISFNSQEANSYYIRVVSISLMYSTSGNKEKTFERRVSFAVFYRLLKMINKFFSSFCVFSSFFSSHRTPDYYLRNHQKGRVGRMAATCPQLVVDRQSIVRQFSSNYRN